MEKSNKKAQRELDVKLAKDFGKFDHLLYDRTYIAEAVYVQAYDNAKILIKSLDNPHPNGGIICSANVPHYTTNLEDAISLIPSDIGWTLSKNIHGLYAFKIHDITISACEPATAICAAIMVFAEYEKLK
jgi:hypothetical protein